MLFRSRRQHDAIYRRINECAQALPGGYRGDRRLPHRYMYKHTSRASFIELRPNVLDQSGFMDRLGNVKGVRVTVNFHDHICVFSRLFPDDKAMKFLLSDKDHIQDPTDIKDPTETCTLSACYTVQPDNIHALEAWRILRAAVKGLELHREIVDELDTQMRKVHRPGAASPSSSISRYTKPLPPPEPCWERFLARDLANAYTLKLKNKDAFELAKNHDMVEMPSQLALRAGLILFEAERSRTYLRYKTFLKNRARYEPTVGMVYCDAGNGIYAQIIEDRRAAICMHNPAVANLCTDVSKGDLVEVVLYQYRNRQKSYAVQALTYLERVIERALVAVHDDNASGPANVSQEEKDESEEEEEEDDSDYSEYEPEEESAEYDSDYSEDEWGQVDQAEAKHFEEDRWGDFKNAMEDKSLMLRFKAICPQSIRWRGLSLSHDDAYIENTMKVMLQLVVPEVFSLWSGIWEPMAPFTSRGTSGQALPTTSCENVCKQFLQDARKRCLTIKNWSQDEELLEHKEHFFSSLPLIVMEKYRDYIDQTFRSKYSAVSGLIALHNGEVVEVPTEETNSWKLTYVHGLFAFESFPEQFQLSPHHRLQKLNEYDKRTIQNSIRDTWKYDPQRQPGISREHLRPDWKNQWNRLFVPCHGTPEYAWLRAGNVTTLGELFDVLHHKYTCRQIYYLYLHLDIVAVKRKKPAPQSKKRLHSQT